MQFEKLIITHINCLWEQKWSLLSAHKLILAQSSAKQHNIKKQKPSTLMILSSLKFMFLFLFLLWAFRFWFKSELTLNGHTEYVWCILISLQVNYAQMLPFFVGVF